MIIEFIFNGLLKISEFIFNLIPNIPGGDLAVSLNSVLSLVFNNLDFVSIFVRVETIQIIAPLFLAVLLADEAYTLVLWIVKKLPVSVE